MELDGAPSNIVVLYNASQRLVKGELQDMLAEQGVIACAKAIAEVLSQGHRVVQVPVCTDVELALAPYPPAQWLVFNLGEGIEGRLFEEARIAWALEAMGYCFTGSRGDALACSTHKGLTKRRLVQAGLQTPPWQVFRDPDEVNTRLRFPLIVKPVAEDASLGISSAAIVKDLKTLRNRVAYVVQRYRQAALVEEFIIGRELNIGVWEAHPRVLPPAEIDFAMISAPCEQIVSFQAKWEVNSPAYVQTPSICPAALTTEETQQISEVAYAAAQAVGYRGYARVDLRMASDGTLYVIEVNCNPDLSPDAGFSWAAQAAGYTYEKTVRTILKLALENMNQSSMDGMGPL